MKNSKQGWLTLALTAFITPSLSSAKIQIVVSADWEGRELAQENLEQIQEFRKSFPDLRIVQFLNAAYFTKPGADPELIRERIASVLKPGDELGLHVHAWKSLVQASGVKFKTKPTFWGGRVSDCEVDCGHDVPISHYSTQELRRVIRFSLDKLEENGFGRAQSFRAGGWMASPRVLEAITAEGFTLDSSSVPPVLFRNSMRGLPLLGWIQSLWSNVETTTQPGSIETPAGSIWEVPDNGSLADWIKPEEMFEVFQALVPLSQQNPKKTYYLHIGFHQETASEYLPRIQQAIQLIYKLSKARSIALEYARLPLVRGMP